MIIRGEFHMIADRPSIGPRKIRVATLLKARGSLQVRFAQQEEDQGPAADGLTPGLGNQGTRQIDVEIHAKRRMPRGHSADFSMGLGSSAP